MVAILFLSVLALVSVRICPVYASFHAPTSILASVFNDVVVEDIGSVGILDGISVRFVLDVVSVGSSHCTSLPQ